MDVRILYTSPINLPKVRGFASQKVRDHAEEPFGGESGQASPRAASASGVPTSYDVFPETTKEDERRRQQEEEQARQQAEEEEKRRKAEKLSLIHI